MPRLAANLGILFTERPLIERFGAAAAAGFQAVELLFPYDVAAAAVKAELARHGLHATRREYARGARGRGGSRGRAGAGARVGRCVRPRARLRRRDRRTQRALHGRLRRAAPAAGGGAGVHPKSGARGGECGCRRHHAFDRAAQSARPAGLFSRPASSMQPTSSAKSAATACASSSIFITRRSSAAI